MTPLSRFRRRFRHHAWAGETLCAALEADPVRDATLVFAHALAADRVWHQRVVGQPVDVAVWPDLEVDGCRALLETTTSDWEHVLDGALDLDSQQAGAATVVRYRNTTGVAFETSVVDILDHVLLHAAHHRGQACMTLRAAGVTPPALDYIAWVRTVG